MKKIYLCVILLVLLSLFHIPLVKSTTESLPYCNQLFATQVVCMDPNVTEYGEAEGCTKNRTVGVVCQPIEGVECLGNRTWIELRPCRYVTNKSFTVALLLSIILGMLGIDRCYNGYWGLGIAKFLTFGYFGIGYYVDIFFILLQRLTPADGSDYIISKWGPRLVPYVFNNQTKLYYYSGIQYEGGDL